MTKEKPDTVKMRIEEVIEALEKCKEDGYEIIAGAIGLHIVNIDTKDDSYFFYNSGDAYNVTGMLESLKVECLSRMPNLNQKAQ